MQGEAPFPVTTPRVADVAVEREYAASLAAVRYAELRARVDGVVDGVFVDEGARVRAGAPIFSVNARAHAQAVALAEAGVRRAEAELRGAELERDHTRALVERAVVSEAELALAEARVGAGRAALEEARAQAGLARAQRELAAVAAPFDGLVHRLPHKVGSSLAANELFTSISDPSQIFAYFDVSEREALRWTGPAAGWTPREVQLVLPDGAVFAAPGVVDAVGGELNPETRTLTVRARFDNPDGVLRHGGTGTVRVAEGIDAAVLVPQRSTRDVQGNTYLYVLDQEGLPRARRIDAAQRVGEDFVVKAGISPDERFVLDGVQRVREGEPITTTLVTEGR